MWWISCVDSFSVYYYNLMTIMCGFIFSILLECDEYHVWIHIQFTITRLRYSDFINYTLWMWWLSCVESYSRYYYNVMSMMYRFIFNILLQCDDYYVWNHNQYTITMWFVSCVESYSVYFYNVMSIMCGFIFNILLQCDDYDV